MTPHGLLGPHCRNPGGDQLSLTRGQFHRMRNVINCHPSWGNSRYCPPSWIPGPNVATDPRGEPLLPDQPPFSAHRRSIATQGGIVIHPPSVFSARHPGCINVNESFKFGHRVAAWPDFPHEKHTTSLQSSLAGRWRCGGRCHWRCPTRYERIICSNSVSAGGLTTGGGRLCVSVSSRCNNFSTLASGPEIPRLLVTDEVNPPVDSCPISVRWLPPPLWSHWCCRHLRQHRLDRSGPD